MRLRKFGGGGMVSAHGKRPRQVRRSHWRDFERLEIVIEPSGRGKDPENGRKRIKSLCLRE